MRRKNGEGYIRKDGYVQIGNAKKNERNLQHIKVAESVLGKKLPDGAIVHHINENKSDNRKENLVICENASYHSLIHQRMRALSECGNATWRKCAYCHNYDEPENLYINGKHARHRDCFNKVWNAKDHEKRQASKKKVP